MPTKQGGNFAKNVSTCERRSFLSDHHFAGDIDAMHLEHVLGEINPERANLHVDGPLM